MKRRTLIGLGEILWDLLPDGRKLGGATANFAFHASALGERGIPVSRVGRDALGEEIRQLLAEWSGAPGGLQIDPRHPTGTVQVSLDAGGQPTYLITPGAAWDYLEWDPQLQRLAEEADAVCFGTLAQRAPESRETIHRFLEAMRPRALKILDINLREPWYDGEVIARSLRAADVLKLNHVELPLVLEMLGGRRADGPEAGCRALLRDWDLRLVCLTRAERGCLMVTRTETEDHPGFPVKVVDSVGAGDAFSAVLACHLLRGSPLATISRAANRYGAWVATQAGATPTPPEALLAEIV